MLRSDPYIQNSMYKQSDIENAVNALYKGEVVLYPTDTIWGLGCDATNSEAVEKIFNIKKRSDKKSLLVLLENPNMLRQYIRTVPEIAWELIDASDKALTIIYPGARNLAPNLIGEDNSVGIRIVEDRFCQDLIRRFKKPIVSTSANISGSKSPAIFDEIEDEIKAAADHIVSWRQDDLQPATASSIIKLESNGVFSIIR
jgi:L-threonylcarbamoyladenylate synthase